MQKTHIIHKHPGAGIFRQIAISLIPGLHCRERLLLEKKLEAGSQLLQLHSRDISRMIARNYRSRQFFPEKILRDADLIMQQCDAGRFHLIHICDAEYPALLREIFSPPYLLYVQGILKQITDQPAVSIVGTRKSTEAADIASFKLALESALCGIPVISGLASGIDSAAHQGAVSCGGLTAAVLGGGFSCIYPYHNRELAEKICTLGGAVISEYPPWEKPLRYHFPERNRIISGLSRSVVLVEAPERSGALITADFALEQGRDLFVHSAGVRDSLYRGTKRLAEEGAEVISSVKEILENWGWNTENCPELVFHNRNTASGFRTLVSKEIYKQVIPYKRGWFERVS